MNWQSLDPQGTPVAVTEEQLRGMVRLGHLKRNALIWGEGMPDWVPVEQARPDLFPALHREAVPEPPPMPPPLPAGAPPLPAGPSHGAAGPQRQPLFNGPPADRRKPAWNQKPVRKSGCGILKWAVLLLLVVVGFTVYRIMNMPRGPGAAELDAAEARLKGATTHGVGDSSGEKKAAEAMAQFSQEFRDVGISKGETKFGRGKAGLARKAAAGLDSDGFNALCTVRGDTAVFLLHVPDLRKFDDGAKAAMGKMAWFAARLGWMELPEPRPSRICVGLKGIVMYDRVLEGMAIPPAIGDEEELTIDKFSDGLQSTVTEKSAGQSKLAAYFMIPAGAKKPAGAKPAGAKPTGTKPAETEPGGNKPANQ